MAIDIALREQLVYDLDNIVQDLNAAEYFRQNETRKEYRTRLRKELSTVEGIDEWIEILKNYRNKGNEEVIHMGTIRDLEFLKRTCSNKRRC